MINLTCRAGESVLLGDRITIKIVRCANGEVELNVRVSSDISVVHRISERQDGSWQRSDIDYECYLD
ncbi:MAG: carbon storage regulator [Gammaproteobacteria bacterium]|nr:carbon storage regulator [Gammaproteobacteria bacterium]